MYAIRSYYVPPARGDEVLHALGIFVEDEDVTLLDLARAVFIEETQLDSRLAGVHQFAEKGLAALHGQDAEVGAERNPLRSALFV